MLSDPLATYDANDPARQAAPRFMPIGDRGQEMVFWYLFHELGLSGEEVARVCFECPTDEIYRKLGASFEAPYKDFIRNNPHYRRGPFVH